MVTLGGVCESSVGTVLGKVLDYPVVVVVGWRGRLSLAGVPSSSGVANTSV